MYISLGYTRVGGKMYTPGEIILEALPKDKEDWLIRAGAICRERTAGAQAPAAPEPSEPEAVEEEPAAPETEPEEAADEGMEPPEMDPTDAIVTARPKRARAKGGKSK